MTELFCNIYRNVMPEYARFQSMSDAYYCHDLPSGILLNPSCLFWIFRTFCKERPIVYNGLILIDFYKSFCPVSQGNIFLIELNGI